MTAALGMPMWTLGGVDVLDAAKVPQHTAVLHTAPPLTSRLAPVLQVAGMTTGDALLQRLTMTAETAGGNDWAAVERGQGRPDARQLREMALSRLHAHTNLAMGTAAVRGEAFSWGEFKTQLEPLLEHAKTMGHLTLLKCSAVGH